MGTLVRQELFKLYKKKSTFILFGAVTIIMIFISVVSKTKPDIFEPKSMFTSAYAAYAWIVFIMIIQASTIITMEFQYGTIKNLLYRNYTRTQVIISKCITLFIYSIVLYASTSIIAIILKFFMSPDLGFLDKANGSMNLLQTFLFNALGNFVGLWLLISLVLLLSCVFRNTAVAIVIGIIFYFAASIVSGIMFLAIEKWEILKWNPLNMLNLSNQISSGGEIASLTRLSIGQLFAGNIIYIIIFLFLVYVVFRKKNV
ncbi:hypothetical protein JNUCC1_02626 [Lentibacillus sp. JNUCC-1]|uniref:ABC transporter permease n=1 Tax=Lentibacillus sp. JNUCC-1 TaxID=2654513 RepID=UPI0012E804C1|nr:ABC transporter permease [Lentibacillus sp. JNUCC-1]MUV38755.1 hypothetical protein [Lentibacillus sp. JNUCC-1]